MRSQFTHSGSTTCDSPPKQPKFIKSTWGSPISSMSRPDPNYFSFFLQNHLLSRRTTELSGGRTFRRSASAPISMFFSYPNFRGNGDILQSLLPKLLKAYGVTHKMDASFYGVKAPCANQGYPVNVFCHLFSTLNKMVLLFGEMRRKRRPLREDQGERHLRPHEFQGVGNYCAPSNCEVVQAL